MISAEMNNNSNTLMHQTIKKSQKDMTKAERRELQEKQRKAKLLAKQKPTGHSPSPTPNSAIIPSTPSNTTTTVKAKPKDVQNLEQIKEILPIPNYFIDSSKHPTLFSHLFEKKLNFKLNDLHPKVVELGENFFHFKIFGATRRCIEMLKTFIQVIQDYQTPPNLSLIRHLPKYLSPQISYLTYCRSMAVSMGNAIRYLKSQISVLDLDLTELEAKQQLIEKIDLFIRDRIIMAQKVIVNYCFDKIENGDVVLTYSCSSIVEKALLEAHQAGIQFRVIVVDSRPKLEGLKILNSLSQVGIDCTYCFLSGISYILKEVTKVFVGAHAFLSNGYLISRTGTAIVSLMAHHRHIPVIVCCETLKFSDRVQLDSFVWNELANPDELIQSNSPSILSNWKNIPNLKLLNLLYDVTPLNYITMVITEVGVLPCSSVPAVFREYNIESTNSMVIKH